MDIRPAYLIAAAAVAAAALYAARARGGATVADWSQAAGAGIVDIVGNVAAGAVVEVGKGVGIPATNQTECQRAKAEGRTWDASFACPAGEFLSYLWN